MDDPIILQVDVLPVAEVIADFEFVNNKKRLRDAQRQGSRTFTFHVISHKICNFFHQFVLDVQLIDTASSGYDNEEADIEKDKWSAWWKKEAQLQPMQLLSRLCQPTENAQADS